MTGFNGLEIGKRSLLAHRFGMDVTSNNIANVNTPGYSRRTAVLKETNPRLTDIGLMGTGVYVDRVERMHEAFFDREIRNNISRQAGYNADTQTIDRIEASFNESSDFGLDQSIRSFFQAFEDLALRPESVDKRSIVLNTAETMIEQFRSVGQSLATQRDDTKGRVLSAVDTMNSLLSSVADINKNIVLGKAVSADDIATFLDERDLALEKLSQFANVQVTIDTEGLANVAIGGNTIVTGTIAGKLEAQESINSISGERTLNLVQVNDKGANVVTLNPSSGEVASLLKHYNVTLDGNDSSGGFSVVSELNALADAIVDQVNTISTTGFGLNDAGPAAPGRNFFTPATPAVPVTAMNMSLDAAIAGQPANIPTADTAGAPGNNVVARNIAALLNDNTFLGNATPTEFYSSILTRVGSMGSEATNGATTTELIGTQLNAQRESINGVSLDEEAINLIKYQKGFEAAARIINTTNDMLGLIINMGR